MARPRQVSDDDILSAARRCFLREGAKVATSVIASEVGLSQAALFKRFQTKQNLMLRALAPPAVPTWLSVVGPAPDERPVPAQLVEIGMEAIAFFRHVMPALMVLKSAGCTPRDLMAGHDVPTPVLMVQRLGSWLDEGDRLGRISSSQGKDVALSFFGAIHMRIFLVTMFGAWRTDTVDDDVFIRKLVDDLWNGIGPSPVQEQA